MNVSRLICLWFLLLLEASAKNFFQVRHKTVFVPERMEACKDVDSAVVNSSFSSVVRGRNEYVVDADAEITRSSSFFTKLIVQFTKCRDKAISSNNCEVFQTWTFKNNAEICAFGSKKDSIQSSVIWSLVPPDFATKCTVVKGHIAARGTTINASLVDYLPFPIYNNLWILKIQLEDGRLPVYCFNFGFTFDRIRI